MKRPLCLLFPLLLMLAYAAIVTGQGGGGRNRPPDDPDPLNVRLPSGKMQRDEIAREDFKKNKEDSVKLAMLTAEVRDELEQSDSHVVSVKMLKKLDDIEKLTRTIRGRLKRN